MNFSFWDFRTLAKNGTPKCRFLRLKNSHFSQMMQMKRQKKGFAKKLQPTLLEAK